MNCLGVDESGLRLRGEQDRPLDVCFDGRRILSFWWDRDSRAEGEDRFFAWPPALHRFLDGKAEVSLVDHTTGERLFSGTVQFGQGAGRVRVEDAQGNPMGLDKSMRLSRLFASRDPEHLEPLLDAIGTVLAAVEGAGLEPFLAYGTLLGAVRDGTFIGHDSDADLGYVSHHDHPVDVIRESFLLQRRLQRAGFTIHRYSGLAFKVSVRESDGNVRGLDVFGGFLREGNLFLMGEVGHPFRAEWLTPRSEVQLAKRVFPAPARPEKLLEVMYGESWRTPDPAFKFTTPDFASRRLNGWFRGTRVGLDNRWARFRDHPDGPPSGRPSGFARWVRAHEPDLGPDRGTLIDLGCGNGTDALWFARSGVRTHGLDYFPRAFRRADLRARRRELPVTFDWFNLDELRSVLVTGALLSREPGPHVITARHLADNTDDTGRANLLRLSRMLARDSGRLYLEVRLRRLQSKGRGGSRGEHPGLAALLDQVAETGGVVEEHERVVHDLDDEPDRPNRPPALSRMVITWPPSA